MTNNDTEQFLPDGIPVEMHYSTFGERLREIRREKGLSQSEFAKVLGISKQILSLYELEQRSPKIEQVQKYAKILRVSVDYLLGDTESEAAYNALTSPNKEKPFYKIFIDVTMDMGLDIPDDEIEALADVLLPGVIKFFSSDEWRAELESWKKEQEEIKKEILKKEPQ